uniref:BTB domain-containing protein n=1 Tax=Labrus bergylta TaxID=56723 RepID=A0A3Q3EUW4_9LABR
METFFFLSHNDICLDSKLRSQREAGLFCDITLRTNGRSYSAHRAVLAAVSDHFQEIFTDMDSGMKADIDLTENITACAFLSVKGAAYKNLKESAPCALMESVPPC